MLGYDEANSHYVVLVPISVVAILCTRDLAHAGLGSVGASVAVHSVRKVMGKIRNFSLCKAI